MYIHANSLSTTVKQLVKCHGIIGPEDIVYGFAYFQQGFSYYEI